MNIRKILEKVPVGTKLYSTLCGPCTYAGLGGNDLMPILIHSDAIGTIPLSEEGKYSYDGECLVFPSASNRDWSTIANAIPFNPMPFDKVLVREDNSGKWRPTLFSYALIGRNGHDDLFWSVGCMSWYQCIPYQGNEELVGTADGCLKDYIIRGKTFRFRALPYTEFKFQPPAGKKG